MHKINHANIKEWAKNYDGEPFDGILCDPPYELGFMGKSWDSSGIAFDTEMWQDLLRHIKPGGHLLAFSGSRTYHRMAVAIEDAGFEIRDMIEWVYGSGFPKSLNISKALDKSMGEQRERIKVPEAASGSVDYGKYNGEIDDNNPITEEATYWNGYGTALKPAHEPCVLARKPLDGTVANNVLKHGTGGLAIDKCRVSHSEPQKTTVRKARSAGWNMENTGFDSTKNDTASANPTGRFPANLIHDGSDEVEAVFPQTGKSTASGYNWDTGKQGNVPMTKNIKSGVHFGDSGSASRFFFTAKPDPCDYSLKYDTMSVCQCINANSVINYLRTIQATTDNTAPLSVADLQDERLDQNVKSAITGCERCATLIAQELVRIKNLASSPEGLTAFQLFMQNYKDDTLTQNLVSIVEKWVNTDTTPTTTNLLTLFGSVLLAIDENTKQANQENNSDTFRLKYTAKASKSERNAGLEGFEDIKLDIGDDRPSGSFNERFGHNEPRPTKNGHPTVKPLSLTKYLATLIKPPTGGRLLVPFSGSGSEMIGALQAGWEYVEGVELTEEYIPIAEARIKYWLSLKEKEVKQLELV